MTARRRSRFTGHLFSVVAAVGLAVVGFGVGLGAGVVWQEPGLVLGALAGRGTSVDWSEAGDEAEIPAPRGVPAPDGVARAEEGASPLPPVSSAPPTSAFAIQVGAFTEARAAEDLADLLRGKGYPAYVAPAPRDGDERWRVRVGPLGGRAPADEVAARLKREEHLPTWVLAESP